MLSYFDYFLGKFWIKMGYFLIQHLVTLPLDKSHSIHEYTKM